MSEESVKLCVFIYVHHKESHERINFVIKQGYMCEDKYHLLSYWKYTITILLNPRSIQELVPVLSGHEYLMTAEFISVFGNRTTYKWSAGLPFHV
jgi:hypothetical protein